MRELDFSKAKEELINLQDKQSIVITVDASVSSELEMLAYKKPSLEELFGSAVRGELTDSSFARLASIVEEYTHVNILLDKIMQKMLLDALGEEAFIYLRDPMNYLNYYFNFHLNSLVISKDLHTSCKTCS